MLRGSFDQALWPQAFVVRAIKPAVCLQSHLLLGRSSLPFANLQMRKMLRGSFHQPSNPQNASRQLRPGTLATGMLLEPSSLPLASRAMCCSGVQACRLPAFKCVKCVKCSAAASTSLQTPKILRGSFDQSLWPQAFIVRAFQPAVCLQSICC